MNLELYDVDDRFYYHQPRHYSDESSTTVMTTTGPAPTGSATPPPSTGNSPSFTSSPVFSSGSPGNTVSSNLGSTTMVPVTTVTQQSTTYTSFIQSLVTPASPQAASTTSPPFSTSTVGTRYIPVCAGQGVDSAAAGILASIILPSVVGLILWVRGGKSIRIIPYVELCQVVFAIVRPRFRQVYGLREWFIQQECVFK